MHILYYSPGACSLAPHIVLEEVGVAFEARRVSIAEGAHRTPQFCAVNPTGRIPALEIDGAVITEVPALLVYCASLSPKAGLIPTLSTLNYARCFELLAFLSSSLHIAYAQLWRPERFLPDDFGQLDRFTFEGRENVRQHSRTVEQRLGSEWALDSGYSIADAYLLPFYRWGKRIGLPMAEDYPKWTAWKERMINRPAVVRAIETESIGFSW